MRLAKHHPRQILGVNLTPLIDIVFLLIIFFMTVSQITRVSQEKLQLPAVPSGEEVDEISSLIIVVRETGTFEVNSEVKTLDEIARDLRQVLSSVASDKKPRVIIKIDRRARSDSYNRLLRELKTLGISGIRIAVLPE